MSVAFTKENDRDGGEADLPDRPISPHPNLVTPAGLAALDAALAAARAAVAAAQAAGDDAIDETALARANRDLRYYTARRNSAQVVSPHADADTVGFGSSVTFDREDGRRQTFRIVGEDEADPAKGSISHVSPIARALMGKRVGDTAIVGAGEVEVIAIA
ncbi:transcription elongation factor GreA [Phreatobacter sp. AB_2022a]|uniref:transcription elongation factor GreA n=1 Tax=Phreatobacter sp. AB_2022a TaxID=3003134 RepID=UPI000570C7BD|nr:transcription elongation factor GreA [Phreatobacter sp. AB_2022a]MCZ0738673.1 transcription elongation factor GreA [Phreatobacter sp. AB_2022a]CEJ09763.1 Transcription elongation factor GreB [bacterium YEK0313]